MTTAQAKLYRFLQDRVTTHLAEGSLQRALRIAGVLVEAARREHPPTPVHAPAVEPESRPLLPRPPRPDSPSAAVHQADSPSAIADDHPRLRFDILFQAAEVYRESGDVEAAQAVFREALDIAEAEPSQVEPLEVAHLNHNFASLFDQLGDEENAELNYQAALDQLLRLDPIPQEQIANISNNLAMISRNQGKLELAEERYLKALEIFEQLRGPEHLDVAVVCNNLGSLYWAWHHPEMARDLHLRALTIRRKHLSGHHADVGQSACNLAAVYHDLNDFDKANRNYQRGLKILQQNIANDPDSYDAVANNYADLLRENGHEKKATNLLKKVERHIRANSKASEKGDDTAG